MKKNYRKALLISIFGVAVIVTALGLIMAHANKVMSEKNSDGTPKSLVLEHQTTTEYVYGNWVDVHDCANCELCKKQRKEEVIAIVDSILRERAKEGE